MEILINSTLELQKYISVVKGFTFEPLKSSIRLAQNRYLKKILGETLFDKVLNNFVADPVVDLTEKQSNLIDLCKHSLAFLSFHLHIDVNQLNISDSGIHIQSTDTMKTAFRWQIQDLKNFLLDSAYANIEIIFEFLEKNISDFPEFKNSIFYQSRTSILCYSPAIFQKGYNIDNNRLTYMAYLYKIEYVEELIVAPMLCDYYDELVKKAHKKQIAESETFYSLTELDQKVLDALQKGIAKLTIGHGIHEFSIEQNVFGVIQKTVEDRSGTESYRPANNQSKEISSHTMKKEGHDYLNLALKIIKANIDEFETYKNSPCYVANSEAKSTGSAHEMRPTLRDATFST